MNKTVLITGASSGIGRAAAHYFQDRGRQVVATMRKPEAETELPKWSNVRCYRFDVTAPDSIEAALRDTLDIFGGLGVVVNNAGYLGPFEAASDAQVRRQFETNVFGVMNVIRAVLPHFRKQQRGVFVNVGSMGGWLTFPLYSLYHATKWSLNGFSDQGHRWLGQAAVSGGRACPHVVVATSTHSRTIILCHRSEPGRKRIACVKDLTTYLYLLLLVALIALFVWIGWQIGG